LPSWCRYPSIERLAYYGVRIAMLFYGRWVQSVASHGEALR
jgi:hypothetical protein